MGVYRRPLSPAHRLRQLRRGRWVGSKVVVAPPATTALPFPKRATPRSLHGSAYAARAAQNPVALYEQLRRRRRWVAAPRTIVDYPPVVLFDSPMHYWRMGAASGDEPDEVVSGAVALTVNATRNVAGGIGDDDGAASFNGTSDYARAAGIDMVGPEITFECWYKPTSYNSSDDDLLLEFPDSAWFSNPTSFIIDLNNSTADEAGTISIGYQGDDDGLIRGTILQSDMPAGSWHHLVVCLIADNTNAGVIKVYVDGEAITVTMVTNHTPSLDFATAGGVLNLMNRASGSNLFAAGTLDEVAWYDHELESDRVIAHYQAGVGSIGEDVSAPTPTVTSVDVTKISRIAGKDVATVDFTTNENFVEYEVRIVANGSAGRGTGTQIETSTVTARSSHEITITDDEFVAASASEGSNVVKIFVKDVAGNWSI